MKALMLKEYKRLELTDVPEPEIGPDDILVRVRACGICGSDIHGYDGSSGRRIPPLVMGHEAAGTIAKVGANVKRFKPDQRVTFDSTVYCGACGFCRRGQINLCDNRMVLGVSCGDYRRHGAFAEYIAVPERIVYALPDSVPFEQAAMIETISIAFHAVRRTPIVLGDSAVVVGAGMVGLLVVQALRLAGCGRITAVDIDEKKLEMAKRLGADVGVKPEAKPSGADLAFEVVGATDSLATAIASLRKGGSLTLVGNLAPKVELPLQAVVTRELTLYGSCSSSGEYPACLDALARGRIDVKPLISATAPLEQGAAWFGRLHGREPGLMKVILQP